MLGRGLKNIASGYTGVMPAWPVVPTVRRSFFHSDPLLQDDPRRPGLIFSAH